MKRFMVQEEYGSKSFLEDKRKFPSRKGRVKEMGSACNRRQGK
ncbi:hypothetical protein LR69_02094 [Geobacillus sp. BCO2]|nr:hypothetical protein LR69_02094 [Geobacillus sp. BCO2]